jgi:para-aminobenzoate synthetase component I
VKTSVHLEEIAYCPDSCELFTRIRDLPRAAFLDSSFPYATGGRYDILTAQPWTTEVPSLAHGANEQQCRAFFSALDQFHRDHYAGTQQVSPDIPFCGGLLGYLGYDVGKALHNIPSMAAAAPFPAVQLCAYDWCIVQDHLLRRATLVSQPRVGSFERRDLLARLRQPAVHSPTGFSLDGGFTSNCSPIPGSLRTYPGLHPCRRLLSGKPDTVFPRRLQWRYLACVHPAACAGGCTLCRLPVTG